MGIDCGKFWRGQFHALAERSLGQSCSMVRARGDRLREAQAFFGNVVTSFQSISIFRRSTDQNPAFVRSNVEGSCSAS